MKKCLVRLLLFLFFCLTFVWLMGSDGGVRVVEGGDHTQSRDPDEFHVSAAQQHVHEDTPIHRSDTQPHIISAPTTPTRQSMVVRDGEGISLVEKKPAAKKLSKKELEAQQKAAEVQQKAEEERLRTQKKERLQSQIRAVEDAQNPYEIIGAPLLDEGRDVTPGGLTEVNFVGSSHLVAKRQGALHNFDLTNFERDVSRAADERLSNLVTLHSDEWMAQHSAKLKAKSKSKPVEQAAVDVTEAYEGAIKKIKLAERTLLTFIRDIRKYQLTGTTDWEKLNIPRGTTSVDVVMKAYERRKADLEGLKQKFRDVKLPEDSYLDREVDETLKDLELVKNQLLQKLQEDGHSIEPTHGEEQLDRFTEQMRNADAAHVSATVQLSEKQAELNRTLNPESEQVLSASARKAIVQELQATEQRLLNLPQQHAQAQVNLIFEHMRSVLQGIRIKTIDYRGMGEPLFGLDPATATREELNQVISAKFEELSTLEDEIRAMQRTDTYQQLLKKTGSISGDLQTTFGSELDKIESAKRKLISSQKEFERQMQIEQEKKQKEAKRVANQQKVSTILSSKNPYEILGGRFRFGRAKPDDFHFASDISSAVDTQIRELQAMKSEGNVQQVDEAIRHVQQAKAKVLKIYNGLKQLRDLTNKLGIPEDTVSVSKINEAYQAKQQKLQQIQSELAASGLPDNSYLHREFTHVKQVFEQAKTSMEQRAQQQIEKIETLAQQPNTTAGNKKLFDISFEVTAAKITKGYTEALRIVEESDLPEAEKEDLKQRLESAKEQLEHQLQHPTEARNLKGIKKAAQQRQEDEARLASMRNISAEPSLSTPVPEQQDPYEILGLEKSVNESGEPNYTITQIKQAAQKMRERIENELHMHFASVSDDTQDLRQELDAINEAEQSLMYDKTHRVINMQHHMQSETSGVQQSVAVKRQVDLAQRRLNYDDANPTRASIEEAYGKAYQAALREYGAEDLNRSALPKQLKWARDELIKHFITDSIVKAKKQQAIKDGIAGVPGYDDSDRTGYEQKALATITDTSGLDSDEQEVVQKAIERIKRQAMEVVKQSARENQSTNQALLHYHSTEPTAKGIRKAYYDSLVEVKKAELPAAEAKKMRARLLRAKNELIQTLVVEPKMQKIMNNTILSYHDEHPTRANIEASYKQALQAADRAGLHSTQAEELKKQMLKAKDELIQDVIIRPKVNKIMIQALEEIPGGTQHALPNLLFATENLVRDIPDDIDTNDEAQKKFAENIAKLIKGDENLKRILGVSDVSEAYKSVWNGSNLSSKMKQGIASAAKGALKFSKDIGLGYWMIIAAVVATVVEVVKKSKDKSPKTA